MRLPILPTIILLWLLSIASPPSACAQNSTPRPNIVLILIDDLRYDTFGYMGHPFVETPNIDLLANSGMQFTRAFVTTSLCSPSRASFLSGRYMHNHKVVDNADPMPEGTITFPQLLQDSGYQTAFIGKWHMGGSSDAPRDGFDHWVSFPGQGTYAPGNFRLNVDGQRVPRRKYMTDELTDYATSWLEQQTATQPFLLYLSHKGVHGLYEPAPRHLDRYRDATVPLPTPIASSVEQSGKPMWVHDQRNSWHGVEFPYYGRAKQSLEEMYRHYCEMILSIDDSVGAILRTLRSRGLHENTLVVFTSDGGHLWGEHGLIDKRCAYEESIRIPLLLYGTSRIKSPSKSDALIANIDVAPSILEMAGLNPPAWMDGRSFVELMTNSGGTESWRRALLYEYYWEPQFPQTPTTFCLRGERFKLIQYHGIWDTDELYDLQNDPRETRNLIRDPNHQQRVSQMRRELHDRLKETNGLAIPLGMKRSAGSNERKRGGSKRAEFPSDLLRDGP